MIIRLPNPVVKKKSKMASNLEKNWSRVAKNEARSEARRARKAPAGPFKNELLLDSKIAEIFSEWRAARARRLR